MSRQIPISVLVLSLTLAGCATVQDEPPRLPVPDTRETPELPEPQDPPYPRLSGTVSSWRGKGFAIHVYMPPEPASDADDARPADGAPEPLVPTYLVETGEHLVSVRGRTGPAGDEEVSRLADYYAKPVALEIARPWLPTGDVPVDGLVFAVREVAGADLLESDGRGASKSAGGRTLRPDWASREAVSEVFGGGLSEAEYEAVLRDAGSRTYAVVQLVGQGVVFLPETFSDIRHVFLDRIDLVLAPAFLESTDADFVAADAIGTRASLDHGALYLRTARDLLGSARNADDYVGLMARSLPNFGGRALLEGSAKRLGAGGAAVEPSIEYEKNPDRFVIQVKRNGLYPTAMDFDANSDSFLVASADQGLVMAVESSGDFYYPVIEGITLLGVVGIAMDQARGRILVANNYPASDGGNNRQLRVYDAKTGKRTKIHNLGKGELSGLAVDAAGDSYLVDSSANLISGGTAKGEVRTVAPRFSGDDGFGSEGYRSVTWNPAGFLLVLENRSGGIAKITAKGEASMVATPSGVETNGSTVLRCRARGDLVGTVPVAENLSYFYFLESDDGFRECRLARAVSSGFELTGSMESASGIYAIGSGKSIAKAGREALAFPIVRIE